MENKVPQPPVQPKDPMPQPVGFETSNRDGGNNRGLSFGGGMMPVIAVGVVVLAVVYFLLLPQMVSKKDFTTNMVNVSKDISDIKGSITTQLNNQNTAVTNQINETKSSMAAQVSQVQNSLSAYASKSSVDSLVGLSAQVNSQLATAKDATDKQLNAVIQDVNTKLASQSANVTGELAIASGKVSALDSRVTTYVNAPRTSGIQLTANVSGGSISMGVVSDQNQYVSFKVVFRLLTGSVSGNGTLDGFLQSLYTTQPVSLSTNVPLVPDYHYQYVSGQWQLTSVEFTTARTAIAAGTQTKTMAYAFNDTVRTWDVLISPWIDSVVGTGGSNW